MVTSLNRIYPESAFVSLSSQKLRIRDIVENKLPKLSTGRYRVDWRGERGMLSVVQYDGAVKPLVSWNTIEEGIRLVKERIEE